MKFRQFSDIHQNYLAAYKQDYWEPPTDKEDYKTVAIVAGDYWNWESRRDPTRLFKRLSEQFREVVYVLGNHEHYGCVLEDVCPKAMDVLSQFGNIHLLQDRNIWLDDVAIHGATLWTDCNQENPMTMLALQRGMCDFSEIKVRDGSGSIRCFSPQDSVKLHKNSVNEIRHFLDIQRGLNNLHKSIVVTHHAPSRQAIHTKYVGNTLNGGWCSELDELIELTGPAYLAFGHVHDVMDFVIGSTRCVAQPRGYVPQERNTFDPYFSFEL